MLRLQIETENDAFVGKEGIFELARLLRQVPMSMNYVPHAVSKVRANRAARYAAWAAMTADERIEAGVVTVVSESGERGYSREWGPADETKDPWSVETMNATNCDYHPIYTVAKTAIDQLSGACLAGDAAAAAAVLLLRHWEDAIPNWSASGPSGPEVERMITGDIRDTIDQLEELLRSIERRGE